MGGLRRAADALIDLLLPRVCAVCGSLHDAGDRRVVCGRCWTRARALPLPQCDRCGHPLRPGRCRWCEQLPPYVRAVRSVCWVPGVLAGGIVHALKYDGWTRVADEMAERMSRLSWPADVIAERAYLIPVPLSPTRERERGFNQSELLARALGTRWHLPVCSDVLRRTRMRGSQTRLTPDRRRINVAGAFHAETAARARLAGAHVVVVDDVITTGATLAATAAALLEAGARIVSAITFGRAPASGDPA